MAGAVADVVFRTRLGVAPLAESGRRLVNLPRAAWGSTIAHAGVGIMVIGIVATTAWQSEKILVMRQGERTDIAGYDLTYRGVVPNQGPNWREQSAILQVSHNGQAVTELMPSKRTYDMPPQTTSEAGIHGAWSGDLYTVLGDETPDGGRVVRLYFNPLVKWIWFGAVIMALGGGLSLSDRRLRVGAPRKSRVAPAPVAAE